MTSLSRASRRFLSSSWLLRSILLLAGSLLGATVVYALYRRWGQAGEANEANKRPAVRLRASGRSRASSLAEPLSAVDATRQTVASVISQRPLPATAVGEAFAQAIAASQAEQVSVEANGASPHNTPASTGAVEVPQAASAEEATETQTSGAFVGNVHTLVYHSATSEHLPIEEHRRYFASEEDALAAGYHRAAAD